MWLNYMNIFSFVCWCRSFFSSDIRRIEITMSIWLSTALDSISRAALTQFRNKLNSQREEKICHGKECSRRKSVKMYPRKSDESMEKPIFTRQQHSTFGKPEKKKNNWLKRESRPNKAQLISINKTSLTWSWILVFFSLLLLGVVCSLCVSALRWFFVSWVQISDLGYLDLVSPSSLFSPEKMLCLWRASRSHSRYKSSSDLDVIFCRFNCADL